MNIPVWKCNAKCYLTINDNKYKYVTDQSNESQDCEIEQIEFNRAEPYIMELTLYIYIYI